MNEFEAQSFGVVFVQNNSLGVCIFDSRDLSINCGQIHHFCYFDKDVLHQKLLHCSQIFTNQPKNYVFVQLQNKISEFKGELRNDSIFHLLNQISFQNIYGIVNKDHYFKMMLEESNIKFKALGMLLYHLINNTAVFKRTGIYFQIIEYWNDYIFQHLQVTQTEINFLEITSEHIHPSMIKARVQNTLGSSILKIYDSFMKTKGGKKYLKRLMLNLTYNKSELQKRQLTIEWMLKYMADKKYFLKLFKNVYAVDSIIFRFQRDRIEQQDWRKLIKSMQCIIQLRNSFPLDNPPEIIKNLLEKQYWSRLISTFNQVNKVIDFSPFGIKQMFDSQLRQLKKLYTQMPSILSKISAQQKWGINTKLIFMPQIGYLVEIPHEMEPSEQNPDWQLKFTNFNGKFYSNQLTTQLDNEYGDIKAAIKDIQTRILDQLQQDINDIAEEMIDIYWHVCMTECFWSISQLSKNMTPPRLSQEQLIVIDGWNMLLGQNAIDNHLFSFYHEKGPHDRVFNSEMNIVNTNYSNRCSILSGPNGAGKTIYMKQLAHCGFYVPASFAQIPLTDRIAIIQNSSSLYSHQAGFEKELVSLSKIMNRNVITNKSLVLIDQIGLSQDYTIALKTLYACVQYLSNNNIDRFRKNKILSKSNDHFKIPTTLIITHLTQLMANKLIEQNYYVRYLTMDVNNNFDFSYKIKPGLVKSGYGIKSAEGFMKNQKFIEMAYDFWNKLR